VPDGPYPSRWEADVVTRDGGTVHVRPIRPSDGPRITDLHSRLSAETIYFRFFSPMRTLSSKLLERFINVDYVDRLALVALLGDDIVAVGRYERLPSSAEGGDEAEVAFLVDDAHQGRGLGTTLLEHLAVAARQAGITRFVADTLADNRRMLRMFHEAGFDDHRTFADGVVRVVFPITSTEASRSRSHRREREAAARSVRKLLAPRSVAVVGASREAASLGRELFAHLLAGDFNGPVFPVNPEATHVGSVRAYPTLADIPDPVDLAVVVVPADAVAGVVEQCARQHVGGLVIVTSGFAELGAIGRRAQRQLVADARGNGMRLIGPNSMGVVNTDPEVRLNATTSPMPPRGRVGFIAQSGGLGVVILDELARRGLGVSTFVSAGNKADVSGNDLLQYWDDDPATDVILMYIESFGNPRTFGRVARRVSRRKPIIAVKSARSVAGSLATGDHGPAGVPSAPMGAAADPAALAARRGVDVAPAARQRAGGARRGGVGTALDHDEAVDALFRRSGVIRTDTLEELFDVAQVLESQPLPAGRRVAIVGNTGGPGVVAADACDAAGLEVVELSAATQARLASSLPWHGSLRNPVDLATDAQPSAFRLALGAVLDDPSVDAAMALFTSPSAAPLDDVADAIAEAAAAGPGKPVIACVVGRRGLIDTRNGQLAGGPDPPGGARRRLPSFAFPEAAANALGRVATYAQWRRRPAGTVPALGDIDLGAARAVVDTWIRLEAEDGDAEDGDVQPHDTDDGDTGDGDTGDGDTDERAAGWLDADPAARLAEAYGLRVDRSPTDAPGATGGRPWDLVVGVTQDALFGPLVTLGVAKVGGPELARAARAVPLTDLDAFELRDETLARAGAPRDTAGGTEASLAELLMRIGRLADEIPEIAELELRPSCCRSDGVLASTVRVRLRRWEPRPESTLRRLR
jgi:acyl-CoA synthetase (NDP forming)/GNAT superfamily N-acetyltransferase